LENFERIPAYYSLFESQLQLHEHLEVMIGTGKIRENHEFDEIFALQHMRALNGLGKYPHALEFHTRFCERLFDHMGAEPGPELRNLYQEVLRRQAGTGVVANERPPSETPWPHQLPRQARGFAGRSDVLAKLDSLVGGAGDDLGQTVVLHGMPGIGKSRLAFHWGNRNKHRFTDGQLVLDLGGHGSGAPVAPDDALGMLLAALEGSSSSTSTTGAERRTELSRMLSDRRVLVVLDNARDSNQVRPLLAALGNCFTLITSRTRPWGLTIKDNVHVLGIPPLSAAETVELLRNEIGADRAAEDPAALRELAGRSDGHPLALRIIAQHVANRPETAIADLVNEFKDQDGLGILGSSDDSDDEDATLPVAFSWSYLALDPATARTFRFLGLHPTAEFSTVAVSRLLDEDEQVTDRRLRTLTKTNLVQHGAAKRYRLHDLLHGYAVDLVQHEELASERKEALERLLDWYLGSASSASRVLAPHSKIPLLRGMSTTAQPEFEEESSALNWFRRERANLVSAVPHAIRHGFSPHCWRIAANLHEAFDRLGHFEELLTSHRIGLKAARLLSEDEAQCGTLTNLGMVHFRLRQHHEAAHQFEAALAIARRLEHRELEAICVHDLASVHLALGEARKAIDLYEVALTHMRELSAPEREASTLDQMANTYRKLEQDDRALELYQQALAIRRATGHKRGEATTLTEIGKLLNEHGEHEAARTSLEEALRLHQHSGDKTRTCEALVTICEVYYNLGLLDQAITSADLAIRQAVELDAPTDQARALHVQGHALALLGDVDAAERRWTDAVSLLFNDSPLIDTLRNHLDALHQTRDAIPGQRDSGANQDPTPPREDTGRHSLHDQATHDREQLFDE
jgi:tetratricopeptide (TPR) repeat protein